MLHIGAHIGACYNVIRLRTKCLFGPHLHTLARAHTHKHAGCKGVPKRLRVAQVRCLAAVIFSSFLSLFLSLSLSHSVSLSLSLFYLYLISIFVHFSLSFSIALILALPLSLPPSFLSTLPPFLTLPRTYPPARLLLAHKYASCSPISL